MYQVHRSSVVTVILFRDMAKYFVNVKNCKPSSLRLISVGILPFLMFHRRRLSLDTDHTSMNNSKSTVRPTFCEFFPPLKVNFEL